MKKINLITLLFALIFASCGEETLPDKIDSSEPILKFENSEEMFDYYKTVSTNGTSSLDVGEIPSNNSFRSFRDVYRAAVEEITTAASDEEYDRLLIKHSAILTLTDSRFIPRITNPFYQVICNEKGMYESGGFIHRVMDSNHMIIAGSQYIKALSEINTTSGLDTEVFQVVSYNSNEEEDESGRVNANCGSTLQKDYFHNKRKCKDDRRAYVRAHAYYMISGNSYTPSAISEAWGEIRTWRCNWKIYDTGIDTRNCSFTVTATLNGSTFNYPRTFANQSQSSGSISIHNGSLGIPITWQGGTPPSIQFTKVHLECTTRGVGNNWVVLDCQ